MPAAPTAPEFPPVVRAARRDGPRAEIDLHVPADLGCFPDHFPRLGILPGVLQLDWAVRLAREHLGITGAFAGLRALKFVNPVLPGSDLCLSLHDAGGGRLDFAFRDAARAYAEGQVRFAPAG